MNVLKLASNDLFTAPAILATMAGIDPDHPVVRSFSAAYWRGGDDEIESKLFRNEYFDTVVAWGGASAIRNVQKYIGPGLDLVALNPKASISLIGNEAFVDEATLDEVARRAANDVGAQEACQESRFQFVEGSDDEVDSYCERLLAHLHVVAGDDAGRPTPPEIRTVVEALPEQLPDARVWGELDGRGLVIRTHEPLDIYPIGRTVNVVTTKDLADPARYADVETQTVGIYPQVRKRTLRDAYFGAGVQRIVTLGGIGGAPPHGRPHDGYYVLARMVRWVADEDLLGDDLLGDDLPRD